MRITRAVVPSLFTVLNMFCGFLSIIHTAQNDFPTAAWFIILAGICDVLDGMMARVTRSFSDFGVEFDSLSDVISFGAAPSFLVYTIHLHTLEGIGVLISSFPLVFGAMRLARFNVQLVGYDKDYFKGLPIPAAAIMISAYVLTYYTAANGFGDLEAWLLLFLVLVVSLLMVSSIKYDNLPKITRRGIMQHPLRFTLGVVALTAIVLTQGRALFPCFVFYIATGPIRYVVQSIQHALHPPVGNADEKETEITSVDV